MQTVKTKALPPDSNIWFKLQNMHDGHYLLASTGLDMKSTGTFLKQNNLMFRLHDSCKPPINWNILAENTGDTKKGNGPRSVFFSMRPLVTDGPTTASASVATAKESQ